eukprot:7241430-Alexandrium_andersonii.AAC.1
MDHRISAARVRRVAWNQYGYQLRSRYLSMRRLLFLPLFGCENKHGPMDADTCAWLRTAHTERKRM